MFPHAIGRERTLLIAVLRVLAAVGTCGFFAVIASAIAVSPALAQSDAGAAADADATAPARLRAQQLLNQGNELFRAGQTPGALRVYREAHQVFPSPKLFFNIALCEEALGKRGLAMQHFSAFLRQTPDASAAVRAQAQARIATLAKQLAAVDPVNFDANAAVRIDGEPAGLTPLDQPIWVEPGIHSLSVERPGKPLWVTSIDVQAGSTIVPTIRDASPAAIEPSKSALPSPDESARPLWRRWWFWTALGVLVASGTVLTVIKLRECHQTVCE